MAHYDQHQQKPPSAYHASFASLIKVSPYSEVDVPYAELKCSDEDRAKIIDLVRSIAETGYLTLLIKHNHYRSIEAQINHVHPFKFASVAFSTPQLRGYVMTVFEDSFKRAEFVGKMGAGLTREADKGKLEQYLSPFAKEMGVLPDLLRPYIQSKDWEGFIRCLITR